MKGLRMFKKSILLILILFALIYLSIGLIPWEISLWHHDYPGPKELSNFHDNHSPDWLLVHGVNYDARLWQEILFNNPTIRMTAISLSAHEQGSRYADPGERAAEFINQYLQQHKPKCGVIGHSTGALWIADAYLKCPDCWRNLKVILLAPNTGTNVKSIYSVTSRYLSILNWLLPDPYLGFLPITGCLGTNDEDYTLCKQKTLQTRMFRLGSIPYYIKLFNYMSYSHQQHIFSQFANLDRSNIMLYLPENDQLLNTQQSISQAKELNLRYKIIPFTSHFGILYSNSALIKKALQECQ